VPERVTIKGTKDGLLVILGSGDLAAIMEQLDDHISQRPAFFRSGRVALSVGRRAMSTDEIQAVGACLQQWGMSLWAVESEVAETAASARALGLEAHVATGASGRGTAVAVHAEETEEAVVLRRTLRSGQAIQHRGHVVVIGDVNPGAEIVAGGHVVVWGRLRGIVHAGAWGDEEAIICAIRFAPTQLRIADAVARSPEGGEGPDFPEMAALRDGVIVVEPWS